MKAESQGTKATFGFSNPAAGTYLWEIGDDVGFFIKDEVKNGEAKGPKALMIPMKVKGIIEGEAAEGESATIFINLVTKTGDANGFGERQMLSILEAVGVLGDLQKKLGDKDVDPTDSPQFAQFLSSKLPGKVLKAEHEITTNKTTGKEQVNFLWTDAATGGASSDIKSKKEKKPIKEAASDDDWS